MSKKQLRIQMSDNVLFDELSLLIEKSQSQTLAAVNSAVSILFWHVGKRINDHILHNKRADYGKEIVSTLSTQLKVKFGKNFELRNVRRMMQFAEQFSNYENVVPLARHLSWSHFVELLPIKNPEAKIFYAQASLQHSLGIRELRKEISNKTFERTRIANTQLDVNSSVPLNTFKDPYILDFLGLKDGYMEKDLESAILKELELFILEVGRGFAFVERQKRMIIDGEDHHLDLLFFHRKLKRLVAIELKIGKFQAKDKGQMELYLKWLNRYDRQEGEEKPIGLILCAETSREQIELLEMDKDGIIVAEYWTDLPPKKEFEERLHNALLEARENLERRKLIE
jgi:predicted nuclease of restriction endonuclease-like (RecB) superfamily